jgi:hypothetical protein
MSFALALDFPDVQIAKERVKIVGAGNIVIIPERGQKH